MKTSWNPFVPRKVNILTRHVLLDRLPIQSNLANINMDVPSILCPSFQLEVEQLNRLFIRCEMAARTWNAILSWLDIDDSYFDIVHEIFSYTS